METINVGLASFGMSGAVFHAPFISHHPGFKLYAIVQRHSDSALTRYPNVKLMRSFEELIADKSIQLVIVNTPDVTHYMYVKQALTAGKHVIVEKPFVFTVREGEELIKLAEKQNRMLCVFQNRRWDGDFLTVKQMIASGVLGRVVEFQSAYQRYRNYIQPNTWKEKADKHVGLTYNLGSHMIDQTIVLFGIPQSIYADIDRLREGSEVDDYYQIHLHYPKIKVTLRAGYLMREETPRYMIHGTNGSFVKYGLDPQEEALKAGLCPASPDWGKDEERTYGTLNTELNGLHFRGKIETISGNYQAFYEEVYLSLHTGKKPTTDASSVLPVIRILEAAFESKEKKQEVSF
ncbi:MAG: Gfo/Idh/MocA family oxidoreductase [Massilibacteroides sp.]|nr:Gfo/Idh/MocA family oxidoreductase [Massilibacteroides sp.]MDD3062883.1 Gfo/Idh/MocA family oxidoreductase [Massilibacteroides sp.]MDD4114715.1 Gfo/Idh/MocA family oxidoreductase [Massilibacteroides sp.]MDD4660809.1 Gfo/Idh/MocA family oxidoreductase [Massilibacteroides sp.]